VFVSAPDLFKPDIHGQPTLYTQSMRIRVGLHLRAAGSVSTLCPRSMSIRTNGPEGRIREQQYRNTSAAVVTDNGYGRSRPNKVNLILIDRMSVPAVLDPVQDKGGQIALLIAVAMPWRTLI
jgi:hypothetical protein